MKGIIIIPIWKLNEVYDGLIEVSLFSSKEGPYEIYFSYGIFYGIIYVDGKKAVSKREDVKNELAQEYQIIKSQQANL